MNLVSFNAPKIVLSPPEYLEFVIDKMKKTSSSVLSIHSKSNHIVACRLRSSSPNDFRFNTENIIIEPQSSADVHIEYKYSIDSYTKFHKFLLQTLTVKDLDRVDWRGPGVHEYKLFAKFVDFQYLAKEPEPPVEKVAVPVEPKVKVEKFKRIKEGFGGLAKALTKSRFSVLPVLFAMIFGYLIAVLTSEHQLKLISENSLLYFKFG